MFGVAERLTGISVPGPSPTASSGAARVMQMVERATTPPMGFEAELLEAFTTRFPGDNAKARRELALEHRSLAEGLREYLAWELEQLGMDRGVRREAASTPTA